MSFREFLRASREPYRRLFSYLTPYRWRFVMGIIYGALFGAVQALMIFDVQYVAGAVFPDHTAKKAVKLAQWFPQLQDVHLNNSLLTVLAICAAMSRAAFNFNLPPSIRRRKVWPSMNSVTMKCTPSASPTSWMVMMLG